MVITGTSSGLGKHTTKALLQAKDYHVIGAVRDRPHGLGLLEHVSHVGPVGLHFARTAGPGEDEAGGRAGGLRHGAVYCHGVGFGEF